MDKIKLLWKKKCVDFVKINLKLSADERDNILKKKNVSLLKDKSEYVFYFILLLLLFRSIFFTLTLATGCIKKNFPVGPWKVFVHIDKLKRIGKKKLKTFISQQ